MNKVKILSIVLPLLTLCNLAPQKEGIVSLSWEKAYADAPSSLPTYNPETAGCACGGCGDSAGSCCSDCSD